MDAGLDEQIRALEERRAFVGPDARTAVVIGADAARWLNDLVTAGVEALAPGEGVRSLLLSPTGRIRAEFHVLRHGDRFLLVQTVDQPEAVHEILSPYVLSSAVELASSDDPAVLVPDERGWRAVLEPQAGAIEVGDAAAEAWRIGRGIARFPVDLDADSLPAEAGLDVPPVTATDKGCFLGQESVARVRNLGHPTRVVRAFDADGDVAAGDVVLAGSADAGVVTSAAPRTGGGTAVLARIRWDARDEILRTVNGARLRPR